LFALRRLDLELIVIPSSVYYSELVAYFAPIRSLAWAMAALIAAAAVFGGSNAINASVQDRLRELASLRAVGYSGAALVRSLAQESVLIAATGGVLGLLLAKLMLGDVAIRISMSAFRLEVDAHSVLVGFGGVLLLGLLGAAPAAWRVQRMSIASALKNPERKPHVDPHLLPCFPVVRLRQGVRCSAGCVQHLDRLARFAAAGQPRRRRRSACSTRAPTLPTAAR
jgi:hypothetical protein